MNIGIILRKNILNLKLEIQMNYTKTKFHYRTVGRCPVPALQSTFPISISEDVFPLTLSLGMLICSLYYYVTNTFHFNSIERLYYLI